MKAKITPDIKSAVIAWLNTETRQQLADRLKISLGSVDRILCEERRRKMLIPLPNHRLAGILEAKL